MANPFQVGAAKKSINPPIGSYIAGDAQNRRFDAQHDDLFAKAIAITGDDESIVLVSLDCIGLPYPEIVAIRDRAVSKIGAGLPPERIIVGSTHVHNGPDVVGIWGPDYSQSGRDPEYMERLIENAADTILRAWNARRPASASYAVTEHGESWVHNECEPKELDRSVTIIQFSDSDHRTIATLTNFACHPTILDGVHNFVSADWIGAYYAEMESAVPGEHLFFQGAIGGWIQPDKGDRSYAWAQECAKRLAGVALPALAHAQPLSGTTIQHKMSKVQFPMENEGWRALKEAGLLTRDFGENLASEVAWFSVGDAQFATHPGETIPVHGVATKDMMGSGPKFVLGLTMDGLGYILPPRWFDHPEDYPDADYLIATSLGRQTAPVLLETLREVIPQA